MAKVKTAEKADRDVSDVKNVTVDTDRETITIAPVTGAIYHNGQEKPMQRWSFEVRLSLSGDKHAHPYHFVIIIAR